MCFSTDNNKYKSFHGKPYFLFPDVLKRLSFRNIVLEYISCIIRKDDISYSRKYDLTPWTENERWFFSKKHLEIWYFLQVFWKDSLFKKTALERDLSCIIWKDGIYFLRNTIFFLWTEKGRWSFSRNTRRHDIFCVYVQALWTWCLAPPPKKIKEDPLQQKYT